MNAATYNAWRLVSLSPLPRPVLWLFGGILLAALIWTARGLRRERRWTRRLSLLGLRLVSGLLLLALLLEPGIQRLQTAQVKSRFMLLVDESRSMAFPAAPGEAASASPESRSAAVTRWAREHRPELQLLSDRFQLELDAFSNELTPLDLRQLQLPQDPVGSRTDLLGALLGSSQAATQARPLAGVLLVSDGADNVQLAKGIGEAEQTQLRSLGAPVNTLSVGKPGLKDLAVAQVQVDDFAFVRNPINLEVTLRSQGFTGEEARVLMTRDGRVVASQSVVLDASGTTKARLTFTPDQTGEFVYTISVPVFPEEAVVENNRRAIVLKVIRDRVRVLLVCGHPSWDERFLRGLLRQDPNVDLVSFFILRGINDKPHVTSDDELSLIPFPTEEIFRTQLHSFDLVVLQDFAYRPFSSGLSSLKIESYFPDIKRYVQEGGALLMIGGGNSFGEGQYDETELADVLPVSGAGIPPTDELFHPQLTEEGRRHPVTQLAENGDQSAKLWAQLPAIPGLNAVRPKAGARVLLEDPLRSIGGQSAPVLVAADEGRGRSMALMTDSSWMWSFEAAGAGLGNRSYERFFTNAVRWLVRDPDLTPVKLSTAERSLEPGRVAAFDVRARKEDYGPAAGAAISLQVLEAETDKPVAQARGVASRDGTVRLEVPNLPSGAYRAVATAKVGDTELGRAEQALAVRETGPETEDPLPHPETLVRLADATGGVYEALGSGFPKLHTVHESEEVEIGRRKEQPLWDTPWPLGGLALALGVEWLLRRRWGWA